MGLRHSWRGFLKVSLVNIPVKVFPATGSADTVSFNQLHKDCQTKIQQKKRCPKCDKDLDSSDIVKGYEFEKGKWVVVSDADLEKIRTESTHTINLSQFTATSDLDPIFFEKPYYLAPDGAEAAQAFAVILDGMGDKAGIGRMCIYNREYVVAVMVRSNGLIMWTLRATSEVRAMNEVTELASVPTTISPEEALLARAVVSTFESKLDLGMFRDQYQEGLRKVIEAKIAGQEIVAPEDEQPKVVNLMDALRKSLATISATKKMPDKTPKAVSKKGKKTA